MRVFWSAPWFALALLAIGGLALERLQGAPITWIGGDGDWNASDANWNPADEPDADDESVFNTPNYVNLANPVESVAGVTMSNGAALVTNGNDLHVSGTAQFTGENTTLAASENSHVSVGSMAINSGAQLYMQGGVVESPSGGMITTDAAGNIYGYGLITAPVNNSGAITAAGGTLTLANPTFMSNPASTADELRVEPNSTLEIRGNLDHYENPFNGMVTIDSGTLFMNQAADRSVSDPAIYDLTGGTLMQSRRFEWNLKGYMIARAGPASTLQGPGTFDFGSDLGVQLDADLRLDADARTHSGNSMSGAGSLIVMPGRQFSDAGGVSRVRNEGSFLVSIDNGSPTGTAGAGFFEQASTGKLVLDFGSYGHPSGDQLIVNNAVLAGDLDLRLNEGYTPQIGENYKVLSVISPTGGYTGTFEHVIQPDDMPPDLMFSVLYGPKDVFLYVIPRAFLSADFNHDGHVDGADLSVWVNSASQNANADVNGDGDSDGADLLAWQRQVGLSGGTGATGVPEPGTCTLAAIVALAIGFRRRSL